MEMNKLLDFAIRDYKSAQGGYKIGDKTYLNYMTNEDWESFKRNMPNDFFLQYQNGNGNEMKETKYPPKMTSFGSSSRLIYELSKDIPDFIFEKKLNTLIGGKSNLDGYMIRQSQCICIEAKCREQYSNTGNKRSIVYKELLDSISKAGIGLTFDCHDIEGTNDMKIESRINDSPIRHFDIIQLICHFCGIANELVIKENKRDIKFVYLIYDPNELPDKLFPKCQKDKIVKRYNEMIENMKEIDLENLFDIVLDYIAKKKGLPKPNPKFEFRGTNQNDYSKHIG